jgi:hypothetical protein
MFCFFFLSCVCFSRQIRGLIRHVSGLFCSASSSSASLLDRSLVLHNLPAFVGTILSGRTEEDVDIRSRVIVVNSWDRDIRSASLLVDVAKL